MKNLRLILLLMIVGFAAKSQVRFPTGFPSQFNTGWNRWGYAMADSGTIIANRDTNWLAKFSGTLVFKPSNKKFYWFDSTNLTWNLFGSTIDTTSLSNRINLKLNISDTTGKWLSQSTRLVDTMYRVNDSTIGFTIKDNPYTFQILGGSGGGGGGSGTVTSVGLSMPSAFTVTGSPITSSGTFAVSGAGTSLQYIRGNGTLATTDTGMIPNFHLKVRSLFTGTSPITFNQTTGAIGINNANAIGTKGAASFTGAFSDNGSGLIDLLSVITAGGCTNCNLTFDAKGRITAASNGSGGSGSSDTAFNGLTKIGDTIQLGGAFTKIDTLDAGLFHLKITGARVGGGVLEVNNTGSDYAATFESASSNAILATASTGNYVADFLMRSSTTNDVERVIRVRRESTGTPANGIGGAIDFVTESTAANATSNSIISIWSDATTASRTSRLELWGVNNATTARKAALTGTGQWIWDGYPALTAQNDTATYKPIAIDGSGNVVKMVGWSGAGGGSVTLNNIGAGFRWLATPGGNFKTVSPSNTILWDSTSTTNTLTAKADTSVLATQYDLTQIVPALTATQVAFGGPSNTITSEAAFNYISATNYLTVDTTRTKKAITDTVRFLPSILNPNGLYFGFFGDSYTVGTAASVIPDSAYTGRLSDFYRLPLFNFAITGVGAVTTAYQHNLNVNYPNPYVTSAMFGLNNLRYGGASRKVVNKILNGYKDIFCNHFSKTFYPASNNTVVTRSGSWTTAWASNSGGGKAGTQGAFTNTLNDYIEFAFTDSTCWFSVIAGDGSGSIYTSPTVDISIDGGLVETISLNEQTDGTIDGSFDGRLIPLTRYYNGLSFGSHTLRVTNKSAGLYLLFDGFGTLLDKSLANTYIMFHVPKLNATGYATAPANDTDPITDTMNAKIDSLVATFPSWYPTKLVRTNDYVDVHAGMSADSVHWNNLGHSQGFDAAVAEIGVSSEEVPIGSMFYASGGWYGKNDTNLVKFAVGDVVYLNGQTVFGDTMRFGSLNDKPVAIMSGGRTAVSFRQNQGVYGNVADFYGPIRAFGPIYAQTGEIELINGWSVSGGIGAHLGNWLQGGTGLGISNNTGLTNESHWALLAQGRYLFLKLINDANSASAPACLQVARTGTHADSILFPMGKVFMQELTRVSGAPDSVITLAANGELVYRVAPAGSSQTWQQTLTTGSTLTGNNTVTGGNNSFTFNGMFNYRINANSFILDKTTATAPYSFTVLGTDNRFQLAYTPTPATYSKGVGIVIDTNNNTSLGAQIPTTAPLYATGNSAFVNGIQSQSGNYFKVDATTSNVTAGLDDYYFRIDATSGNITITLPAASTAFGASMGIHYVFKRIDASGNTVTIARAGSDTIDGATSITLTAQYEVKELQCSSTSTWDVK